MIQSTVPELTQLSPNVASIAKQEQIPVSKYTGTSNLGVPIYTLDFDGLPIPVNLSYATGGIKVMEEASWVGLGWNLSGSAVVTRSIKGIDDLDPTRGYPYAPVTPNSSATTADWDAYYDQFGPVPVDTESDVFVASLFGSSFKFILPKPATQPSANAIITGKALNNKLVKIQYQ